MGKRGPQPGPPKVARLVRLDAQIDALVAEEAAKYGMSVPGWIAEAVTKKFSKKSPKS